MLQRTLPLIAVVIWAWSHDSWAGAYKWVDETGQVHYSQRPPPGQTAKPVQLPKTPRAADSTAQDPASSEQPLAEPQTKQPPEEAQTEQAPGEAQSTPAEGSDEKARQALAETQRKNCSSARANLQRLQAGRRITAKSADGKVYYLDDAEREAQVAEASARLRANCQ